MLCDRRKSTLAAAQGQLIYGRDDFERRHQPLASGTHREPGSTSRKTACKAHNPRSMTRKLDCRPLGMASAGPFSRRTRPLGEVRFPPVMRTMTPSHTIGTDNGLSGKPPSSVAESGVARQSLGKDGALTLRLTLHHVQRHMRYRRGVVLALQVVGDRIAGNVGRGRVVVNL